MTRLEEFKVITWKLAAGFGVVDPLVVLNYSRQSEVGDLDLVVVAHENVARGQIPVDVLLLLQVGHSAGDLFERAC